MANETPTNIDYSYDTSTAQPGYHEYMKKLDEIEKRLEKKQKKHRTLSLLTDRFEELEIE